MIVNPPSEQDSSEHNEQGSSERSELYASWVEKYNVRGSVSVVTAVKGHASSMNLLVQVKIVVVVLLCCCCCCGCCACVVVVVVVMYVKVDRKRVV